MKLRLYKLLLAGLLLPGWCFAQVSLDQSYLSFDIDNVLELGSSIELVDDGLLSWSASGGYGVENILSDNNSRHADLTSISVYNSVITFTFDTTIKILDGSPKNNFLIITPQDFVIIYGTFDSAPRQFIKQEIPALENSSSKIDALSPGNNGTLVSLDRTTLLAGSTTITVEPADVFLWRQSNDSYTLLFDSSSKLISRGMNVDAISWDNASQLLYLSFDTAGKTGGKRFDANSILVYNPADNTLVIWDNVADDLTIAGLGRGANLDAMALTFVPTPETIFSDSFEQP